ncbi:MAG: repeat-containing protein [Acidimicrobiales bacterium]|nr:repeat-containing protein [Acidimicrobiales bacterium]
MRTPRPAILFVGTLLLAGLGLAPAPAAAAPPQMALVRTFDRVMTGWGPAGGTDETFSTPALADITGDGIPELVVAGNDGAVTAWYTDGRLKWKVQAGGPVLTSPVIADVGGDGKKDVVVGTMSGGVVWIDGPTGRIVRTFPAVQNEGCRAGGFCALHGFFATPSVADLNGDGQPEIIATSWDHQLYGWRRDGAPLFRVFVRDTIWSSATVVDVDGDGRKEIIFGGDRTGSPDGGYLWMFDNNGNVKPGFPKILAGQVIWSSPAVVDLDGDKKLDIVVGTGLNYPAPAGYKVYAFDSAGNNKGGWPVSVPSRVIASPAIGDVNGDGRMDVVVGTEGGYVTAISAGGTKLWTVCNRYSTGSCSPGVGVHGQAVIADVDNDGKLDVVSTMEGALRVLRGSDGAILREGFMGSTFAPSAAPTVGSVGGKTWIVQTTLVDSNHSGRRDAGDTLRTYAWTTGTALGAAPWPTFRRNSARTGFDLGGTSWYPFRTATALVRQQYRDLLGREGDAAGVEAWVARLESGELTGADVVVAFLRSAEFGATLAPVVRVHFGLTNTFPASYSTLASQLAQRRAGTSTAAIADAMIASLPSVQAKSDEVFINDTYRFSWGGPATADQMAAAKAQLAGGASRGTVLVGITDHAWAKAALGPNVDVTMTYVGMLRRIPDSGGYTYWVAAVRGGTSLVGLAKQFQFSAEYAARFR